MSQPGLYVVDPDQPPGRCPVDLFRRGLRYLHIPDYREPGGKWTVKGSAIKAVVRDLAEYATYATGENARPSIAMLAVGAEVSWPTANRALLAAEAYRLIEKTTDARGRFGSDEWRLLNLAETTLHLRTPQEMHAAADAVYLREKGPRKPPPKPPAAEAVGEASTPQVREACTPQLGEASYPRPKQLPTPSPIQKPRAPFSGTDRAREPAEEDHPMVVEPAEPNPPDPAADPPAPVSLGLREHRGRPPHLQRRRAWIDDGSGPESARYRQSAPTTERSLQ